MDVDLSDEAPDRRRRDSSVPPQRFYRPGSSDPPRPWLWATAVFALIGGLFAGVSTADFISHLDRQYHEIHCSLIPGAGAQLGDSGCRTVMMSPYSSVLRESMWGGLPISLLALAVFAYLVYRASDFALRDRVTKHETLFLVVATLLPVLMSLIYGYISLEKIGSACKLCIGVYASSALTFVAALIAHSKAGLKDPYAESSVYVRWFFEGVGYVAVLAIAYLMFAPTSEKSLKGCGTLVEKGDPNKIMIPLGGRGSTRAVAVLDPLCPSCKAFDQRVAASSLEDKLSFSAVLFPLDSKCNWMIKESLHPGACMVSEALLCDPERAKEMLDWVFQNQEILLEQAKSDERGLKERIAAQFPQVKSCIGSATIKNKVNKSLRWAVKNAIPVLTPQLFVGDTRVCDEDTDLGLEYTVAQMLEGGRR
jgi:uncharacterized membrane protein